MNKVKYLMILSCILALPFVLNAEILDRSVDDIVEQAKKIKKISLFQDLDNDGSLHYYGHNSQFADLGDCNDRDASIHPGATEIWYDNIDQNCDELSDFDQDYDGYSVIRSVDCDDTDASVHPLASECNDGVDQNCNGSSDEKRAPSRGTYYSDSDNDAYGNPAATITSCGAPTGYVSDNTDCNDSNNLMNPGMTEYCNGFDDDCDLTVDENDAVDAGTWYADTDHDAYGNPALTQRSCSQPANYVNNNTDCNDSSNTVYPTAPDAWYDGIDSNCAGDSDYDSDTDGYDSNAYSGTDCNDADNAVHPLATETWYDGIDQNCNGDDDYDQDTDTYQYDLDPTDGDHGDLPA